MLSGPMMTLGSVSAKLVCDDRTSPKGGRKKGEGAAVNRSVREEFESRHFNTDLELSLQKFPHRRVNLPRPLENYQPTRLSYAEIDGLS